MSWKWKNTLWSALGLPGGRLPFPAWQPLLIATLLMCLPLMLVAQHAATWRAASPAELKALLPARATVEKEHIETESRTASGITDGRGNFVAGIVLITAGYSADGKYSHFLMVGSPVVFGSGEPGATQTARVKLAPGEYVIGWQRLGETLAVRFYDAGSGAEVGELPATRIQGTTRVESFRIWPPGGAPSGPGAQLQIGRFGIPFQVNAR